MPRIPDIYGARPTPRFQRSTSTVRNAGAVAEAAGGLGAAVADYAGKAIEKEDKLNYAAAKAQVLKADLAARTELQEDQDFGTFDTRYTERMAKEREAAAKLIKSKSDRAMFDSDVGVDVERGLGEVRKLARDKRVSVEIAGFDQLEADSQDIGQSALDAPTREAALTNYSSAVDGMVGKGNFSAEEGGKRKRAFAQSYEAQGIQSRINSEDWNGASVLLERSRGRLDAKTELQLENQLRGGVDRRKAWERADDALTFAAPVAEPGAKAPVADGGKTAFMQRVGGAESGGNDNAKNNLSSASGRYQFTKGTWEQLGGDWADRFDPGEQERLMGKLTAQNEAALKRGGVPLTAGNYYLAHFAGAGGARALHSNPNAPVEQVLGAEVVRANSFLRGMKGGDVIDWAAKKMGGAQASVTSDVPDLGMAYGNIDARADAERWTPEETERAKEQVSVRINRMKAVENERQSASYDVAMEKVATMGDDFTDVSQLGQIDVSGTQLNTLTNIASANARALRAEADAGAKAKMQDAQDDAAERLDQFELDSPAEFAATVLDGFYPDLSAKQRKHYAERQKKVRADLEGWTPYKGINAAVTRAATFGGVKLEDKDKVAVRQIMMGEAERLHDARKGQEPSEKDYDALFVSATRDVRTKGSYIVTPLGGFEYGTSAAPRYRVKPSVAAHAAIESALKEAGNKNPSEEQIMDFYRRNTNHSVAQ